MKPFDPFNLRLTSSSSKLGKVESLALGVQHIWCVRTVMVMAGGTCGARLSPLNWRVCAGLTGHYMGEGA